MPPMNWEPSRREALRTLAAGMALSVGACGKPDEEIVPYVRMPERLLPGVPTRYATALSLSGWARGIHAVAVDGRPIKVEGNPLHSASEGATDVFAEAAILDLYDPDRSRTVTERESGIAPWEGFLKALAGPLASVRAQRGKGLRLLTGRVTSPTLARQIDELLAALPEAGWHVHEPADDPGAVAGAMLAYGRPLRVLPHLDRAETILALGADPLGHGPEQIRFARAFAERRRDPARFGRLYVAEAAPTLTGLKADERLALLPDEVAALAVHVARGLGADLPAPTLPERMRRFAEAALADLRARPGLVLAGPMLGPEHHALVHWINARIGAPVDLLTPPDAIAGRAPGDLAALSAALRAGEVACLAILGANPVHTAPADIDFGADIARAGFSLHAGLHANETAGRTHWHLPISHELESWSDLRATDGTASLVQPLVRPLYGTRTAHAIVAVLAGTPEVSDYERVRETWRPAAGADFESWWRKALHDGIVPGSRGAPVALGAPHLPVLPPPPPAADLVLVLAPDPGLWDGRYADNAWLQECPKPVTKQVWGNALMLAHAEAARRGLRHGDVVRVRAGERVVEAPVALVSGMAESAAALTLGYGRTRAGPIGTGVGADAYRLATTATPRVIAGIALEPTGRTAEVLTTQNYTQVEGETKRLFPQIDLAGLAQAVGQDNGAGQPTLLAPWTGDADGHAWGMVIDTAACIGCNACVVACQSENNVPVVGPEEVARGRMMHWLRVDLYDAGTPAAPKAGFQPVPCMHCEHAPCEPVCPVAASVHDGEGLNAQVYNRCVGTRFCQANCPYKVRRFNFFGYANGQEYGNLGAEPVKAQRNPNVTVRARGVMEKCTYCVQRIATARQGAERDGQAMGEVVTACQSACPTRAIHFGDLAKGDAAVTRLRGDPRHYALMAELNTRPRTTYLANLRSPHPDLAEESP